MAFVVSFLLLECKQTPYNKGLINIRHTASMQEHSLLTLMNALNIAIQGSIILVQPHCQISTGELALSYILDCKARVNLRPSPIICPLQKQATQFKDAYTWKETIKSKLEIWIVACYISIDQTHLICMCQIFLPRHSAFFKENSSKDLEHAMF